MLSGERLQMNFWELKETTFLHLQVLTQKFLKPVEELGILSVNELYKLSANLSDIIQFHKGFLEKLQNRIGKWNDQSIISDLFLENYEFFNQYLDYMLNFGEALLNLSLMRNKYHELEPIIKSFEDYQLKTTRLTLESLFVMPVQRVPRYILLLKEMKKYTGKVNPPEEEKIGIVADKIQAILTDLNQKTPKGNLEAVKRLQMILESVEGELYTILDAKSVYVKEGALKLKKFQEPKKQKKETKSIVHQWENPHNKPLMWGKPKLDEIHTCFLLEHILLICKFNEKGARLPYKLVAYVAISEMDTVSFSMQNKAKSGVIFNLHGEGLIQLNGKDTDDAKAWITELQLAVSKFNP